MIPDARELHRVTTASVRELIDTARLEGQAGAMDADQVERLIFRAAAPIVHRVVPLTETQRGELLPNIVRVMLAAFLEEQSAMTAAAEARVPPQGAGGGAMKSAAMRWRCIAATLKPHGRMKDGAVTPVRCLPDTVDPRGPKAK